MSLSFLRSHSSKDSWCPPSSAAAGTAAVAAVAAVVAAVAVAAVFGEVVCAGCATLLLFLGNTSLGYSSLGIPSVGYSSLGSSSLGYSWLGGCLLGIPSLGGSSRRGCPLVGSSSSCEGGSPAAAHDRKCLDTGLPVPSGLSQECVFLRVASTPA